MSANTYELCHRCAAAITNNDYSAFDYSDSDKAKEPQVIEFVEKAGLIYIDPETTDIDGRCDACGDDIDGPGHTAEEQ